jgi:signal transduction histidine kinase
MNQIAAESEINKNRIKSLINNMSDGVIALGDDLKVTDYNASALNLLDLNTSIEKIPINSLIHLIDKDNNEVDIKELIRSTKKSLSTDIYKLIYPEDKSTINLSINIAPIYLGFGNQQGGYVLTLRDITQQKSLSDERDEFISVVSHELRNPIAIAEGNISNAIYSIEKNIPTGELKKELEESHKQVLFLADLINDLTSLSRAENNKSPTKTEIINASELANELATEYDQKAKDKKLELKIHIDPDLEVIYSSKLYVKEILQNFVTNAIKYTDSGNVALKANKKGGGIEFSVSDTGIGISKADATKVFDKFFRSGDFRTSKVSGTGLGLYIAIKLSKIIGGNISFDSKLNHGSTFKLYVPDQKPLV